VHRDDLKDFRVEAFESNGSLKPEDYLEWVQAMERIIEIKGYQAKRLSSLLFSSLNIMLLFSMKT